MSAHLDLHSKASQPEFHSQPSQLQTQPQQSQPEPQHQSDSTVTEMFQPSTVSLLASEPAVMRRSHVAEPTAPRLELRPASITSLDDLPSMEIPMLDTPDSHTPFRGSPYASAGPVQAAGTSYDAPLVSEPALPPSAPPAVEEQSDPSLQDVTHFTQPAALLHVAHPEGYNAIEATLSHGPPSLQPEVAARPIKSPSPATVPPPATVPSPAIVPLQSHDPTPARPALRPAPAPPAAQRKAPSPPLAAASVETAAVPLRNLARVASVASYRDSLGLDAADSVFLGVRARPLLSPQLTSSFSLIS